MSCLIQNHENSFDYFLLFPFGKKDPSVFSMSPLPPSRSFNKQPTVLVITAIYQISSRTEQLNTTNTLSHTVGEVGNLGVSFLGSCVWRPLMESQQRSGLGLQSSEALCGAG